MSDETWDMKPYFRVREYVSGQPFIVVDGMDSTLPILDQGILGLDLEKGTSTEEAQKIADLLNNRIAFVTYTGPPLPSYEGYVGRGEKGWIM